MKHPIEAYRHKLFEAQEIAVRIHSPEFTEDQVKARCAELQAHIINAEENRPMADKFQKIWNSKIRPR